MIETFTIKCDVHSETTLARIVGTPRRSANAKIANRVPAGELRRVLWGVEHALSLPHA